jgi:hypothetical protein
MVIRSERRNVSVRSLNRTPFPGKPSFARGAAIRVRVSAGKQKTIDSIRIIGYRYSIHDD